MQYHYSHFEYNNDNMLNCEKQFIPQIMIVFFIFFKLKKKKIINVSKNPEITQTNYLYT